MSDEQWAGAGTLRSCGFPGTVLLPVMRLMIQRSELWRWRDNFRLLSDGRPGGCGELVPAYGADFGVRCGVGGALGCGRLALSSVCFLG